MKLEGKSALVTGSTSGIGLGIAIALAQSGATLVLNGRTSAAEAEPIRQRVAQGSSSDRVHYLQADLSKAEGCTDLVRAARERVGAIDILVNNAGIQYVAPLEEFPPEKWVEILSLNLSSAFHTTRLVLKDMKSRRWGRIINIGSAHSLVASSFKSAYVAAKHGLLGLTKVTAMETAEHGITANIICPGYVLTPLVEKQIEAQAKAHGIARDRVIRDVMLAQQPNKQFATVEELGALAVFLCSDAAKSITGAALPVDGGWTAH
jgi:3-hydroxybutyrate dehydrogenase